MLSWRSPTIYDDHREHLTSEPGPSAPCVRAGQKTFQPDWNRSRQSGPKAFASANCFDRSPERTGSSASRSSSRTPRRTSRPLRRSVTRRPGLGRYSWIEDLGHGHESDLVRLQGERLRLDLLKSGFQFSQLGLSSSTTNTLCLWHLLPQSAILVGCPAVFPADVKYISLRELY